MAAFDPVFRRIKKGNRAHSQNSAKLRPRQNQARSALVEAFFFHAQNKNRNANISQQTLAQTWRPPVSRLTSGPGQAQLSRFGHIVFPQRHWQIKALANCHDSALG